MDFRMRIDSDEALARALEAPSETEDFDFKEAKSSFAWEAAIGR